MKVTADKFLDAAAETYRDRNKVYGDNFMRVGGALAALFPDGITLRTADDFNRFHIFVLGVVKQSRYCVNWDKGGHQDSVHDQTVYGAMLEAIDADIVERGLDHAWGERPVKEAPTPPYPGWELTEIAMPLGQTKTVWVPPKDVK